MTQNNQERLKKILEILRRYSDPTSVHPESDFVIYNFRFKNLAFQIIKAIELDEGEISEAIETLSIGQCKIIKDGIEQGDKIGHYGRLFIAHAIAKAKDKIVRIK